MESKTQSSTLKSVDAATYIQIAKELTEYKLKVDRYYANTLMQEHSWLFGLSSYGIIVVPAFVDSGYVTYEDGHLFLSPEPTKHSGSTESDVKSIMLYQIGKDIRKSAMKMAKVTNKSVSKADVPDKGVQFKVYLPAQCAKYEGEITND